MIVAEPIDIIRDTIANRRVIFTFLLTIAGFSIASALIYFQVEKIDYLNALYFTVINMTTVGFGDIHPLTPWGKGLAVFNSVLGVILFGYLVSSLNAALQREPMRSGARPSERDQARARTRADLLRTVADAIEQDPDSANFDDPIASGDGWHEAFVGVQVVIRCEKPVAD